MRSGIRVGSAMSCVNCSNDFWICVVMRLDKSSGDTNFGDFLVVFGDNDDGFETDFDICGIISVLIWFATVRVPSCNFFAFGVRIGSIYINKKI